MMPSWFWIPIVINQFMHLIFIYFSAGLWLQRVTGTVENSSDQSIGRKKHTRDEREGRRGRRSQQDWTLEERRHRAWWAFEQAQHQLFVQIGPTVGPFVEATLLQCASFLVALSGRLGLLRGSHLIHPRCSIAPAQCARRGRRPSLPVSVSVSLSGSRHSSRVWAWAGFALGFRFPVKTVGSSESSEKESSVGGRVLRSFQTQARALCESFFHRLVNLFLWSTGGFYFCRRSVQVQFSSTATAN